MPAREHVPSATVKIGGSEIAPELMDAMVELRVRDSLSLPASALVRFTDPGLERVDSDVFKIGKPLDISIGGLSDQSTGEIFKGEIVAFEPEFTREGVVVAVRAYDKSHRLQRSRKVRTWQNVKASDIVSALLQENGLTASTTSTSVVYEFFQQSGETDRELIGRFEREYDYRFYVDGNTANFKPASESRGGPITLTYSDQLLSFRPRVSAVQQLGTVTVNGWNPKAGQSIAGQASNGAVTSQAGLQRPEVANAFGRSQVLVADRTIENSDEATRIARSTIERTADSYLEAEGTCYGNPDVRAGVKVKIAGVGRKLSGTYVVSSTTHVFRSKGYETHFQITGRSERGLLDLVHPPQRRDWGAKLVVGVVTNVNDKEKLGRVRVKYPALSDSLDGGWARVLTHNAAAARGIFMLPQVGDEVVVAFENGDTRRPLIVGSLFNGAGKPGEELLQNNDGSFAVLSNEKGLVHTKKDLTLKSDQKMIVQITSDKTEKADGKIESESGSSSKLKVGSSYEVEAGGSIKIKGASISVEAQGSLSLKGATVSIESSGPATLKGATVDVQGSSMTNIKGALVNIG